MPKADAEDSDDSSDGNQIKPVEVKKMNQQPNKHKGLDLNR